MTNTTLNVPRELMERARAAVAATNTSNWSSDLLRDIHAILSAPSPAGVDGLKRYEVFPYLDDEVAELDICESDDGSFVKYDDAQAIIDGLQEKIERLQFSLEVAKTDELSAAVYAETESIKHSLWDAEKERYKQARRIGELEGLLRHAQKQVPTGSGLHMRIDAALSAGKEGE